MATVPFIRYLRPNGRREAMTVQRPDNIAKAADAIREHGFRFECEVLTTGDVALSISDDDADYLLKVCANGPDVLVTVDLLISEFDVAAAIKRRDAERSAPNSD